MDAGNRYVLLRMGHLLTLLTRKFWSTTLAQRETEQRRGE